MDKLCVIRWAVRGECFRKIKKKYQERLHLMRDSVEEKLDFAANRNCWLKKTVGVFLVLLWIESGPEALCAY